MCEPSSAPHTSLAAQSLYAKLQKLSEDIQLQQSIITAQKQTVLKSRQKNLDVPKAEPVGEQTHLVHTHAGTVLQHRAMIIKHYELIQQHKQMVKEQSKRVKNLTSTLINIQQETTVVDELMNTKMVESRINQSPPTALIEYKTMNNNSPSMRTGRTERKNNKIIINNPNIGAIKKENISASPDTSIQPPLIEEPIKQDNPADNIPEQITTITTTTSTTTTTPTFTTTATMTISSISTPTSVTTTSTTTTTTTTPPPSCSSSFTSLPLYTESPSLPLSP